MRFVVLGGYGIIGREVVRDLFSFTEKDEVIIAGRDSKKIAKYASSFNSARVIGKTIDVKNKKELISFLKKADICINCLQYNLNLEIMKACLEAKINYVDLGGMFHETLRQLKLNKDFQDIGKTAILGLGASPGMSNILAAYGSRFLKEIKELEIVFADKDFTTYKQKFVLPYSFKTLVDEYTMKPAVFRDGKLRFVEPRSEPKKYNFGDEFGVQTGYLTLHSELATLPEFFEKRGLKKCEFRATFPEDFSETIKILIENGFTSHEELLFSGKKLEILNITTRLMDEFIPKIGTKIADKEIIRVMFNKNRVIIDMITHSNKKSSGGTLNTGIPCSIGAQMILNGNVRSHGVFAPEYIINPELMFKELRKRGIAILKNGITIN